MDIHHKVNEAPKIESDFLEGKDEIIKDRDEAVKRAVERWIHFYNRMWNHSNVILEKEIKQYRFRSNFLRISVIILTTSLTVLSGFDWFNKDYMSVASGIIAILTSLEGYFKYSERNVISLKQQRDVRSVRDKLAYDWLSKIEIETDMNLKLEKAKEFFEKGPEAYNDILNRYTSKINEDENKDKV